MLSEFFCDRRTFNRVQDSPSAPYLEGFADAMRAVGYARTTILSYLRTAAHVGAWARREGIALADLDETAIEAFRGHLSVCECPGPRPLRSRSGTLGARAHRFLEHLRATDTARSAAPPARSQSDPALLGGFNDWMRQHRGARPATLSSYGRILLDAIGELGDDPSRYEAASLRAFVLDRASRHGRSKAKLVVTAMRMFLRYLSSEGQCPAGLDGAIPTIAQWSLAALPRYLTPSEVDQVLGTCDPTTPGGSRNRAVLLLLSRLGLRASDVAALRFSDIDWEQATVRVAGKSRRTSQLPLPQFIGNRSCESAQGPGMSLMSNPCGDPEAGWRPLALSPVRPGLRVLTERPGPEGPKPTRRRNTMAVNTQAIFGVVKREGMEKGFWTRIGTAFQNQDAMRR
jgi:site-specific recombinase XerD